MAWPTTSRHSRGYDSRWDKLRLIVLSRDKYLCQPCLGKQRVTPATQVDHVVPKATGGTDDASNCQAICGPCHSEKSLRESAEAQGRAFKPKVRIGLDGWAIED